MKKVTNTIKQTHKLAEDLAKKILSIKDNKQAIIVVLVGELGAGKTVFVRGFAKALGIKEKITSPTFVILKRFKNLVHIDAYRIDSKDLKILGWKELINDPKNIILIEWADRIKKSLPKKYFLVNFKHKDKKSRAIDISLVK